jgi:hypothetical protein
LSADVKNEHNVTPRAPTDDGTKVTAVGRQSGCGQLPTTLANHEARLESLRLYYVRILNPMTDVFLVMEHCGAAYVGTLFLNDTIFCREIFEGATSKCQKNDSADWRNRSWQHSGSSFVQAPTDLRV